jgi:hypothetical protein
MARQGIYSEIEAERDRQQRRWGDAADDTKNTPNDWAAFIGHHATRWFGGGFAPYDAATVRAFRAQMIKVATLAVAAVESLDRQARERGKPFYEKGE